MRPESKKVKIRLAGLAVIVTAALLLASFMVPSVSRADAYSAYGGEPDLEVVNGYPGLSPYGEAEGADPWGGPDHGGGRTRGAWVLSDKETFSGSTSMDWSLPDGPVPGRQMRVYSANAIGRFTTRRFAPVVLDVQTSGGYASEDGSMPLGFLLDAAACNLCKRLTLHGSYGFDTVYSDFDRIKAPVTHRLGGSMGYKISPRIDLSGGATYTVTDYAHSPPQEVYQGGLAWRPAADDDVRGSIRLVNSAGETGYAVSAGYRRRFAGMANVSVGTGFTQDWLNLAHGHFSLSYSWRCGKYLLSASETVSMDEFPAPEPALLGGSFMLKATRIVF
ncbi:MAG: hypothetical protein M0Z58_06575 [Nitrospiraceae bacterium]|nr:hypothetical protein [Nitrospiraceae bacterium]